MSYCLLYTKALYATMGEAKYALVDFFQRDEVDIVDTKDIHDGFS